MKDVVSTAPATPVLSPPEEEAILQKAKDIQKARWFQSGGQESTRPIARRCWMLVA
jgi:hypothetical protein